MQKLSEEQKKLIQDHYPIVLRNLKRHFYTKKFRKLVTEKQSDLPYQAVSYMAEAAATWDPNRSQNKRFDLFATRRCIQRLIDHWRKECRRNRHTMQNNVSVYDEKIEDFLYKIQKTYDTNLDDYAQYVLDKSDQYFCNPSDHNALLHKQIVQEYIIPMVKSEKVNLPEVAIKLGINTNIASSILKGKKMKEFVKVII